MAIINKDEVKGKFEQGKGTVKDKAGELTGNERLEAEGEAEHAKGDVREGWGKVKRNVSNAVEDVADAIND
ncbi:MAG TPA: CsbD family protein [Pyrinomonadaceae bacterium]|nr:CsbD family protein [Pyrinomonadaceae bacterium]